MEEFANEAYYTFFNTLADRTRLAIIDFLREEPKTISEISAALNQKPAATSVNLERLTECALIRSEKSGNQIRYSLNMEIVEPLGHILALHTAKHCPGLKKCIPENKLKNHLKKEAAKETYIKHE